MSCSNCNCACTITQEALSAAGIHPGKICPECQHFYGAHIHQNQILGTDFVPTLIKEKIILPDIPDELELKNAEEGSNHASTIFRYPDICEWFVDNVIEPREWKLEHPDEVPSEFSKDIMSYSTKFAEKGLKLWDISNDYYSTVRLNLVSERNPKRSVNLSGRADYLITTKDYSAPEALSHSLCVIEKQSGGKPEKECEYQLQTYLFLLMNKYEFCSLLGLLILDDGRCRAFKATRSLHSCLYCSNDTFNIFFVVDIVEKFPSCKPKPLVALPEHLQPHPERLPQKELEKFSSITRGAIISWESRIFGTPGII